MRGGKSIGRRYLILRQIIEPLLHAIVAPGIGDQEADTLGERPLRAQLDDVRALLLAVGVGLRADVYCGYGTSRLPSMTVRLLRRPPTLGRG